MLPFLQQTAQSLKASFGENLSSVFVVLSTRRACLYMKRYLAETSSATFLSPEILSYDDFIAKIADVEIADHVALLFELYESYKQFDNQKEHDLDKFAPLGAAILKDFELIDKNLIPAESLFELLEEEKAIERWARSLGEDLLGIDAAALSGEQVAQMKDKLKLAQAIYMSDYYAFWGYLRKTYHHFRSKLLARKMAYAGLATRLIYENLENLIPKHEINHVVFVGFNLLAKAEEGIMRKLQKMNKASFFWDADKFYTTENTAHEGGHYFRRYMKHDENANEKPLFDDKEVFKNNQNTHLKQLEKNITIIEVSNKITQAKLCGDIVNKMLTELENKGQGDDFKRKINHTGIILADETMLIPLLHSLPEESKGGISLKNYLNVTMGLSMDKTPLFYLIDNLFEMQNNFKQDEERNTLVYYKDIIRILRHPFIQYSKNHQTDYEQIQNDIEKIQKENLIYVPLKDLREWGKQTKFYSVLFRNWGEDIQTIFTTLFDVTEMLAGLFHEKNNALEGEFLFLFYKLLRRIEMMLGDYFKQLSVRTFKMFLYENIKASSVPFTGEPLSPMQVMGMLESRCLDFENVIILSCNEGILPKGKLHGSVLPFDLRLRFGLPTHVENDASFAYIFYRLFHRATNITLIYTTSSGAGGESMEKSRFITQINEEFKPFKNVTIQNQQVQLALPVRKNEKLSIPKTPEIIEKVKNYLTGEGVTPTYVNMFIKNPLEFFQKKILKLKNPDEIEEMMMVNTFGSLVHEFLEDELGKFKGQSLQPNDLRQIVADEKKVAALVEAIIRKNKGGIVTERGKNFILKKVAQFIIKRFLYLQADTEAPFYLVEQENRLTSKLAMDLPDSPPDLFGNPEVLPLKLWGKTDRIDIRKNEIRVVDYKTGTFYEANLKAADMETLLKKPEKEKIVQLMIYKYLLIKDLLAGRLDSILPKGTTGLDILANYKIVSGFYFFRKMKAGFKGYQLDDEPENNSDFIEYVEKFMQIWVDDMLDVSKSFAERELAFGEEEDL